MATDPLHRVGPPDDSRGPDEDLGGIANRLRLAARAASSAASRSPWAPVATLAFFEMVTMARAEPLLEVPAAKGDAGAGEAGLGEDAIGDARQAAGYD